jgi:membrane protease YdiL (CAAX protease family)
LKKIGGLARALYILLAIVAGFVALGTINTALLLLALGLIAGTSMPRDRLVLALLAVIALPMLGTALTHIPSIGTQLNAVMTNLQMGVAGASVSAMAIFLYELVMEGITGLAGHGAVAGTPATATR